MVLALSVAVGASEAGKGSIDPVEDLILEVVMVELIGLGDEAIALVHRRKQHLLLGLLVLPDHLVEPGHAVGQGGYFCRVLTVQLAGSKFELGDLAEDGVMDVEINVQWAGHGCSSRRYGRQCSRARPATERTDRSCRTRYRCKEGLRDT